MTSRKRGRPKGASRYNEVDHATLIRAAGYRVRGEAKTKSEAFRMAGAREDSHIRRLIGKWNANSESYLTEANHQEQLRAQQSASVPTDIPSVIFPQHFLGQQDRMIRLLSDPGWIRKMQETIDRITNPPWAKSLSRIADVQRKMDSIARAGAALQRASKMQAQIEQITRTMNAYDRVAKAMARFGRI